jgi:hypothetical protein
MPVPFDPLCWLPLVLDGSGCRRPWPWGSSIQISSKVGPPSPSHKILHQLSGLLCGIRGTIAHKPYRDIIGAFDRGNGELDGAGDRCLEFRSGGDGCGLDRGAHQQLGRRSTWGRGGSTLGERCPACSRVGVSGISQVPRRSIPCLCLVPGPRPNQRCG